jgi:hypothetical protein
MGIFNWLNKKKNNSADTKVKTGVQPGVDAVDEKKSSITQEQTIEITGAWLNQVWKEKPVQVYAKLESAMEFLSHSKLPYLWSDIPEYIDNVNSKDDPQKELRIEWTAAYLNHPNAEIVAKTLANHITPELLNSWMVAGWLPYLIIHSDSNVRNEASRLLWKCQNESTIKSIFGVFSGDYAGMDSGKAALQGKFKRSAKLLVKNLREKCPSDRKEFFEDQVFEVFGPSLAKKEGTKSSGEVKFKEREVKTRMGIEQTYEVYTANNKEDAMVFLEKTKVDIQNYYVIVETPEGNWGKDCMGTFEE